MSSKNDRDNRSNQLNPNSAAYESSRSEGRRDDSDDDGVATSALSRRSSPLTWVRDERDFALGFVGHHGQVRLIRFRLNIPHLNSDLFPRAESRFDDFLEHLSNHVSRMLRVRWGGGIALRMAFDASGEVLKWMTWLHSAGERLERCDVADPACPVGAVVKPGETVEAREILFRAATPPFENWGTFEMPSRLSSLTFDFERRCQELVKGNVVVA
jgi:hypothetical protein